MDRLWQKTAASIAAQFGGRGNRVRSKFNLSELAYWCSWLLGRENTEPKAPYTHVCQIGDPVLRATAEPVLIDQIQSDEIKKVIKAMKLAVKHYNLVGVAAPQIGVPLRIILIEMTNENLKRLNPEVRRIREMEFCAPKVIINPLMTVVNHKTLVFPEGCASVSGFSASVRRFQAVHVDGLNEAGDPVSWTARGWLARIVQHEMDHLNGRIYTDIMDARTFQCQHWYSVNYKRGRYKMRYR